MATQRAFPRRDPVEALRAARAFYRAHGLTEWVAALPRRPAATLPRGTGFDAALAFPPVPVQVATLTLLIETLATRPVRRLDTDQQYGEPLVGDLVTLRHAEPRDRPLRPYVLLFRSRGLAGETRGATPTALHRRFQERGCHGLTLHEYLVLQRMGVETWRDHRFDAPQTRAGSQLQWLLDAPAGTECCAAHWSPAAHRVEIHFGPRDRGEPGRGAHSSLAVAV